MNLLTLLKVRESLSAIYLRVKAWFFSVRWLLWAIVAGFGVVALYLVKAVAGHFHEKTAKAMDDQLIKVGDHMATVEGDAVKKKAEARATTEEHLRRINEAASEPDPAERLKKLASELNSL